MNCTCLGFVGIKQFLSSWNVVNLFNGLHLQLIFIDDRSCINKKGSPTVTHHKCRRYGMSAAVIQTN